MQQVLWMTPELRLEDDHLADGLHVLGCLRSESEVSALGIGTCCFPRIVHEMTVGPRPASRRHTGNVETDHPRTGRDVRAAVTLLSCQCSW